MQTHLIFSDFYNLMDSLKLIFLQKIPQIKVIICLIQIVSYSLYNLQKTMQSKTNMTKGRSTSKQESIYAQSFEIIPAEVVFKDIEVNQYYEITVEIRNLTNRSKRIRFQKPQNPNFKVIYTMQPEIASGLSTTAKIKYECKELKNQTQIIKVISQDGLTVELPVRVYKMESQILFQPFIDMGFLKIGKEHEQNIAIKNNGKAVGTIQFSHDHGQILVVDPKILKIAPQEQTFLKVKYKPTQAGIFKGSIKLKSEAILVKESIDIHATSVDHSRYIIDDKNNQTTNFDFGTMFVGEQGIIRGFVVNNSPKKMIFKTFFRKGYLVSPEEFVNVQTPNEIGSEQSERVMFMEPESASIEPFQELQVRFYCKTKVNYRDRVFTKSYALTPLDQEGAINHKKNSNEFKPENIYEYSLMLTSEGDDPIILQLKANAVCPQVKLQTDIFKFGDCQVKDSRQLAFTLENKSNLSKVDISFQKIPNFSIVPLYYNLKPNESTVFKILFEPKTIGKIDSVQKLYVNKIYDIDLRCFGIATSGQSRSRKRIQSIKQSPQLSNTQKQMDLKTRSKAFSVAEKTFISQMRKSTQQAELVKLQFENSRDNKEKYNKFLIDRRTQRLDKQKQQVLQKKWSLYQTKLQDLGAGGKYEEKLDDEGIPTNGPIDYEFETGMIDTNIKKQNIPIPNAKERLFVTKHIADYEPLPVSHNHSQKFNKSVFEAPKKLFPQAASNFNHKREIAAELSPEELSAIQIATNSLNFGDVYVKSKQSRYFWVKNGTKKAISICLKINNPELSSSYKKNQVILSGGEAGFELAFCKDTLGDFKTSIKYEINDQHEFEMTVIAKSVPVQIDIDKTNLKFEFDPNSVQMSTTQTVNLYNSGNSNAFFKFILNKERLFTPKILQGTLKSKQKFAIPITLAVPTPTFKKNEYNYTQRIIMKVLDGNQITLTCNYSLVEPKFNVKCDIFNQSPVICLGHQLEQYLELKNLSKTPIVFHVEGKGISISEKLKLSPDEVKKLKVKFVGQQAGKFNCSITITPRGGQKKILENVINVIEPNIVFSHEALDMGVLVVHGIAGASSFTLINKSTIELPLLIDIRSKKFKNQNPDFIQNMKLQLADSDQQLQVIGMTQKTEENVDFIPNQGENLVGQEIDEDQFENSESDQQNIPQKNEDEERRYRLYVKPQKVYKFNIEFFPKEAGNYEIQIPMSIEKSVKIQSSPYFKCKSINPQFIFEPSLIDFKRKIVTKPDRCYPKFITVLISNIDEEDVNWFLKDDQIKKEGIFQIEQTKGTLKSKEKLQFKVSFNPYTVGQYNHKLPLFITSSKVKQPLKYVDVILKGTSSLPMLYFNKRQVIMPVVPLDIQTTSSFRVLNDGYENCNLKCQFIDDVANIGVKLSFPQGLNIGITKQKIRVDLAWKFNKPMSFCLKLQFTDDMNRTFSIPVSGTADNCIFTNYTYFLRNENKFTIKTENSLQLVETTETQSPSAPLQRKNSAHSLKSNVTNKSVLSYLGVTPISPTILANTIDYINRYLNSNLLTVPITNVPGSFIENDGAPLFQILSFVSNKSSSYPWRVNGNEKGLQKVQKIFEQYNQLIKMLKIEGAHLNHIRPEYLLSFSDLNMYLSNLPPEKSKFYMPSLLKINSGLYNYLSMQSWITLLYQIFKIYVLARLTPKNFKQHLPTLPEIPAHYLAYSNFSSHSENILFFWCQQAVAEVLLEQRRLTNFDKDFRDGTVIGSLLQKYANVMALKRMKMICSTEQDFKQNANILCQHLAEIGLQNHISPKDIFHPLQRQMLLFVLHLYVYLPFYTPKQEPVVFKCILGEQVTRTIQLSNPSGKPVSYIVKYEGCDDFKLVSTEQFRIEPKQTYKFEVRFVSRLSTPVKGRIMFINVKEKSLTAAALVFQLKSQITGRVSDRIWNVSGLLYEQIEFPIEVTNKFSSAELVDFTITYQTEYIFDNKYLKSKNPIPPLPKDMQIQTIYGKAQNIKIRKNGTGTLTLNYIPMSLFTTKTTIFFVNNVVGQFQHEIVATVQPPAITAEIRPPMTLSVDQIVNWQFQINPKNDMISRAKKAIQGLKKNKKGANAATSTKQANKTTADGFIYQNYLVQIGGNPYVSSKETIIISDRPANEKAKESKDQSKKRDSLRGQTQLVPLENKIPFTIICKNPVYEFSTYALVSNKSKTDVRRYRVVFTIQPKPLKAILQMNVPARSEVTQNLPIVNNTQRDWNIKITWLPDSSKNGNYFIINNSYSTGFPVKRNSIGNFPITFKPKWAYIAEAKLIMTNPLTLDNFQYQIVGNGEEPLAEEHIEIKCEAKQIVKRQIIVKNPYQQKPINLKVQTDLLNCESAKKLTIPSGGKEKFEFVVQPMLCGQYTGSITFTEEEGPQYIWYTVSIVTNYPVALKTMNLESQIRKKHIQKLQIPYTGATENSYQVIINGSGLNGYPTIQLKPGVPNIYELQYVPLEVGEEKGSICFINPEIGQILYEFNLKCYPKPPVVINNVKSPLGVSTFIEAQLENPTNSKVTVRVINTNPEQFALKNNIIKLNPHQTKNIEIQYIPASLDNIQTANIKFTSKDIGDWQYDLSGMGLSPVPFPPFVVYNGLMEEHSDSVKFRNPFKYDITVGVKMIYVTASGEKVFRLLNTSKSKFEIQSFSILQIPFSFIPNACSMYECKILVMISQKIFWTFPIKGITEINEGKVIANLFAQCRTTTSQYVQIPLEGIENYKQNNIYEFKLENVPANYQHLIDKFLIVDCPKKSLNHAKDTLEFEFLFKPMKPGKVSFDFLVTRQQGSRWRFKINLQGTQPEPDDFIEIQSSLLVTSTISFKMTNTDKSAAQFKAKFTSDSAHEFSVEPKEGQLAKFGSKGTNFFVSFTPVEYGKEKKGKLVIQTAEMYWSYLLKGSLPKYIPPSKPQVNRGRANSQKK